MNVLCNWVDLLQVSSVQFNGCEQAHLWVSISRSLLLNDKTNTMRPPQTGADPENELGGGRFRGSGGRKSPSGVQGRSPGRGLRDEVPQKLTTFRS